MQLAYLPVGKASSWRCGLAHALVFVMAAGGAFGD
jgi:hypothetical protein